MLLMMTIVSATGAAPANQPIDVLDYFLQKKTPNENWTVGGLDVRPDSDPEGGGRMDANVGVELGSPCAPVEGKRLPGQRLT